MLWYCSISMINVYKHNQNYAPQKVSLPHMHMYWKTFKMLFTSDRIPFDLWMDVTLQRACQQGMALAAAAMAFLSSACHVNAFSTPQNVSKFRVVAMLSLYISELHVRTYSTSHGKYTAAACLFVSNQVSWFHRFLQLAKKQRWICRFTQVFLGIN